MICFLDSDGVINVDHGHVGTIDRLEIFSLLPHVVLFLKKLGYRFVVITNQSGLARGYYSYSSFLEVSFKIINFLDAISIPIEVNYCSHLPEQNCNCRKPNPGMIQRYNITINDIFIGDQSTDMQAALNAGIKNRWLINPKAAGPYTQIFNSHQDLINFLPSFQLN